VRDECLDFALETRQRYGIWGGTTERQRRRMMRRTA
jgi:WhiB family redox-sensing transcriptional regulator